MHSPGSQRASKTIFVMRSNQTAPLLKMHDAVKLPTFHRTDLQTRQLAGNKFQDLICLYLINSVVLKQFNGFLVK